MAGPTYQIQPQKRLSSDARPCVGEKSRCLLAAGTCYREEVISFVRIVGRWWRRGELKGVQTSRLSGTMRLHSSSCNLLFPRHATSCTLTHVWCPVQSRQDRGAGGGGKKSLGRGRTNSHTEIFCQKTILVSVSLTGRRLAV